MEIVITPPIAPPVMTPILAEEVDEGDGVGVAVAVGLEVEIVGLEVEDPATINEIPVNGAETVVRISGNGKKMYSLVSYSAKTR